MLTISQFWLDRLAGKPLGRAWAKKDAELALSDLELLDELPQATWMRISTREQLHLLRQVTAQEAA